MCGNPNREKVLELPVGCSWNVRQQWGDGDEQKFVKLENTWKIFPGACSMAACGPCSSHRTLLEHICART